MRQHHVQMPLVHGHVGGFHDRATRMMQPWAGVGKFHEVPEIRQRCIAAPLFKVRYEGRSVAWLQHHVVAAKRDGLVRVARMQPELGGRRCAQASSMPGLKGDAFPGHPGARLGKEIQCHLIAPEFNADPMQNPVGLILNPRQGGFIQQPVGRDPATDERRCFERHIASGQATATPTFRLTGVAAGFEIFQHSAFACASLRPYWLNFPVGKPILCSPRSSSSCGLRMRGRFRHRNRLLRLFGEIAKFPGLSRLRKS